MALIKTIHNLPNFEQRPRIISQPPLNNIDTENGQFSIKYDNTCATCYIMKKLNNIFITILDSNNNVIISLSGGSKEFKGAKKITPYRTEMLAKTCPSLLLKENINKLIVKIQGNVKKTAIKSVLKGLVASNEIQLIYIENYFNDAHNGCRLKKPRRI